MLLNRKIRNYFLPEKTKERNDSNPEWVQEWLFNTQTEIRGVYDLDQKEHEEKNEYSMRLGAYWNEIQMHGKSPFDAYIVRIKGDCFEVPQIYLLEWFGVNYLDRKENHVPAR